MIKTVPIDQIKADPKQPRKVFSSEHIKGLAINLKTEGMINPIEVDENDMIITGECRWRAAKKAGWKEVPINVNERKFSKYGRLRHQMSENLHQSAAGGSSPMNAIDVAEGYKRMLALLGYKYDLVAATKSKGIDKGLSKLSRELGIHESTIRTYLGLLSEPPYVLQEILKGKPHSIFVEAQSVPEKYREEVKKAIADGRITGKRAVRRFGTLAKARPDLALVEFLRITQKQSELANRILNRAIELSLAIKGVDQDKLIEEDKRMIQGQLGSTSQAIRAFLGRLKTTVKVEEGEIVN